MGYQSEKNIGLRKMISYFSSWEWIYDFSGIKEVAETLDETDDENIKLMIVGKGISTNLYSK